jgi:hypothetical protein
MMSIQRNANNCERRSRERNRGIESLDVKAVGASFVQRQARCIY